MIARASGRFAFSSRNDVESIAVGEPHVDHGEGRRLLRDRGETFGDRLHGGHDEAATFHRPRQTRQEGLVVIDDQQRLVRVGVAKRRKCFHPYARARFRGIGLHYRVPFVFFILGRNCPPEEGNLSARPFCLGFSPAKPSFAKFIMQLLLAYS